MALNCKQGDLAVVVRSSEGVNLGKIVRCIKQHPTYRTLTDFCGDFYEGHIWLIDPPLPGAGGFITDAAPDAWLRPIRDNDGTDEMLRIAGLPRDHKQPTAA
ncbi:MAG: hypothetical protein IIZ92_03370 [Aquincola sp.]|nr:hypothetical protein [Aquincola sp.]